MAEKEKRRATTFRTSRGAIVNVSYPDIYIAPGIAPADVTSPAEMREALREELASPRVIVDYGWGYKCTVYTSLRGETVFNVFNSVSPLPTGKPHINKVFRLEGFSKPVEIGDLYALDSRNQFSGNHSFITLDGSVLVCTSDRVPASTWVAIWRYNGVSWSKVYEDPGTNMQVVCHFSQDPITRAIYGGHRNNVNGKVLKSTDDGQTWAVIYNVAEASISHAYIYDCGAYNNNVILTKREKGTYIRSADGGATWAESAVLPIGPRIIGIYRDLGLSFITSDNYVYYSRDYFVTYKRIRIQNGAAGLWAYRYPIRVGGRLLLSADWTEGSVILASRDLYHTCVPVFSLEGHTAARISGYGDFLFVGHERYGTLTRITLPKTLERGLSNPILLWESEAIADLVNGSTTDYVEAQYNDQKTFYIYSTQAGTLYIQIYDEVAATYRNIDNVSVSANVLTSYIMTGDVRLARLSFVPLVAATVSAWAVMS